jgi:Flp pilus assembly protein TadD
MPRMSGATSEKPTPEHHDRGARRASIGVRAAGTALLALLVLAAFYPVLGHEFLEWDDHVAISQNPDFLPPRLSTLGHYWTGQFMQFYVPLTYTIWWVIAQFAAHAGPDGRFVLSPAPYHAANLIAHIGAAVLAYLLLARLTRSEAAGWTAAALFALHPLQVEPVSWASTMYSPLSSCLSLGAMGAYLAFSEADRHGGEAALAYRPPARRWLWYALFVVGYGLALLTKPMIILLPVIIGLIEVAIRRRALGRTAALLVPVLIVGAVPIVIATQQSQPNAAGPYVPLVLRPLVASDVLAFYVRYTILPLNLAPDYGRSPHWLMNEGSTSLFTTWVIPFALFAASALAWRRSRWPAVACGVFVLALAPVLGFTPFDFQRISTVADRYMCFALIAPAMLVAAGLARVPRRALFAVCAAVGVTFGVMSNLQARHWRDTDSFFELAMARNPDSFTAHTRATSMLEKQGREDEALEHYRAAVRAYPGSPRMWFGMGRIFLHKRMWNDAVDAYARAAELEPENGGILSSLALALAASGRHDEAVRAIELALPRAPNDAQVHEDAAAVYGTVGRFDDARREFNEVIRLGGDANAARIGLETLDRLTGGPVPATVPSR